MPARNASTASKPRRHNAGADHCREQKGRAQTLGDSTLRQRRFHAGSAALAVAPSIRPISLNFFCRLI